MKKALLAIASIDLVLLNIFLGYFVYRSIVKQDESPQTPVQIIEDMLPNEASTNEISCPASCVELIGEMDLESESGDVVVVPTAAEAKTPAVPIATKKVKTTSYLPIPGSGNTLNSDWTDLEGTDFYLSTADYPGLVGVYFEANIKLLNGNGTAFVRLYDVTNSRGVDSSTLTTSSQTSVFTSNGPLSLWSGYNHYRVQAKSLTADTTYFESGSLKIISEN